MALKTKYLTFNNGLPYYQRVVPPHLRPVFQRRVIKIPLRTRLLPTEVLAGFTLELSLVAQVTQLAAKHTAAFETAIRSSMPSSVVLDLIHIEKDVMLSEALQIYLKNHRRGSDSVFSQYASHKWRIFMQIVGDMPLQALARRHAKIYRDERLKEGLRTTTVQREISTLSAIIRKAFFESDVDKTNPFSSVQIVGLGEDIVHREPFSVVELQRLISGCLLINDSRRRILVLIALTGMRLNEALGIRLIDLHLVEGEVPYVEIKPHKSRRLKTRESERDIPLLPIVNSVLRDQLTLLAPNEEFLFPEYANHQGTKSNQASATLNKYIHSLGIDKSIHSLRHSLRDQLREAGITKDVIDSLGGWSSGDIGSLYGRGYSLKVKYNALASAFKPALDGLSLLPNASLRSSSK